MKAGVHLGDMDCVYDMEDEGMCVQLCYESVCVCVLASKLTSCASHFKSCHLLNPESFQVPVKHCLVSMKGGT
jgi:hypothetical protein